MTVQLFHNMFVICIKATKDVKEEELLLFVGDNHSNHVMFFNVFLILKECGI